MWGLLFMEIKAFISVEDIVVIKDNMDYFKSIFPRFKIISDYFVVDDERFVEYTEGADMFDWKEVTMEIDSYNNFWCLAKFVQQFKMEKL